jgi:large conductance mechanosensitive channel
MPAAKKIVKKTDTKIKQIKKPTIMNIVQNDSARFAGAGRHHVADFFDFIRQQGIVGLAVGLAVGTAAGASVKAIVDGLINPIVGFAIGGIDLSKLQWVVVAAGRDGKGGLIFSWGSVLSSIITLIATALVIYLVIHIAKLDQLDKKKDA